MLQKVLKEALKGGKYVVGGAESVASLKSSKAVILTRSAPPSLAAKVREEAGRHGVPVIEVGITSADLARMMGRPYSVSTLALKSIGEADLKQLLK